MLPPIAPPAAPPPAPGPAPHRPGAASDHQHLVQRAAGHAAAATGAETAQRVDPATAALDARSPMVPRPGEPRATTAPPDPDPPSGPEPAFQRGPLDEVRDRAEQRLAEPAEARRPAGRGDGTAPAGSAAAETGDASGADRSDLAEIRAARATPLPAEAERAAAACAASPARAGGAAAAPRLNALS